MNRGILSVAFACAWVALSPFAIAASETPIMVRTPTGELHGTLMLPAGRGRIPVALIIAGSGPTDRDGNQSQGKNDSLKMLAQALADGAVASVRFDKRGIGASAAAMRSESELTFTNLVSDAAAWVSLLAADDRFASVSIIGHSEGSTIGMLAAQKGAVASYISIAGPAKKASELLRDQLRGKLPPDLQNQSEAILLSLEQRQLVADVSPRLAILYRPSVQPYLIDWFNVVPTVELTKLRIPCLLIQGDTDIQVPVSAAQALHDAQPDAKLTIVKGMNHVLKLVSNDPAQQMASYRDPALPIAPELGETVVRFIASLRTDVKR